MLSTERRVTIPGLAANPENCTAENVLAPPWLPSCFRDIYHTHPDPYVRTAFYRQHVQVERLPIDSQNSCNEVRDGEVDKAPHNAIANAS